MYHNFKRPRERKPTYNADKNCRHTRLHIYFCFLINSCPARQEFHISCRDTGTNSKLKFIFCVAAISVPVLSPPAVFLNLVLEIAPEKWGEGGGLRRKKRSSVRNIIRRHLCDNNKSICSYMLFFYLASVIATHRRRKYSLWCAELVAQTEMTHEEPKDGTPLTHLHMLAEVKGTHWGKA